MVDTASLIFPDEHFAQCFLGARMVPGDDDSISDAAVDRKSRRVILRVRLQETSALLRGLDEEDVDGYDATAWIPWRRLRRIELGLTIAAIVFLGTGLGLGRNTESDALRTVASVLFILAAATFATGMGLLVTHPYCWRGKCRQPNIQITV
jgi:hypothetical protein